jgi:hypothetical protein
MRHSRGDAMLNSPSEEGWGGRELVRNGIVTAEGETP